LAPVDRLVQTAEAYLKEHPTSAEAHYTLGRIHYLAFSSRRDQIAAITFSESSGVRLHGNAMSKMGAYSPPNAAKPNTLTNAQLVEHATAARVSFQEALRLDPKAELYHLGLASLLDAVRAWIASSKPDRIPAAWTSVTTAEIRKEYSEALTLALTKDAEIKEQPMLGLDEITSYEAAKALIRLAETEPATLTARERKAADEAQATAAKFDKLPRGPITPIVLSMRPARYLEEMLAPDVTVDFDLRGYGPPERWSWVKPELGFLVWDPLTLGRVDSARDLFGSYSFQIFRKTGYAALAALDDNGDGQLSGDELAGIRVWFDRNSDGVSTASEVVSLDALGITAIAVQETARDGIYPMNPTGLTLRDGRTLPTWDWITESRPSPNPEPNIEIE
jgi:hypothetical protein